MSAEADTVTEIAGEPRWLTPGVGGIGVASLLADLGHELPTALLPTLLTSTLGAPASALGVIEGIADGLAGAARLGGSRTVSREPHGSAAALSPTILLADARSRSAATPPPRFSQA